MEKLIKKSYVISASLLLLVVLAIIWLNGHAFITINTAQATGDKIIELTNSVGDKVQINTTGSSVKRLVAKDEYQVSAFTKEGSAVGFVRSKGFLSNTPLSLTLAPEAARDYVGNNPSPCMNYVGAKLISYECRDSVTNINNHVPASASTPTYTVKYTGLNYFGLIEGIADTKLGTILVSQSSDNFDEPSANYHDMRILGSGPDNVITTLRLSALASDKDYSVKPFGTGFIAYDGSFNNIYYYSSLSGEVKDIKLSGQDTKLKPISLTANTSSITALYSTSEGDDSASRSTKDSSRVVLYKNDKAQSFDFNYKLRSAAPCGDDICTVSDDIMTAYSIDRGVLTEQFKLHGVVDLQTFGNQVLAITNLGIVNVDSRERSAIYSYTFASFKYCGLQTTSDGYLICVIDSKNNKSALIVNSASKNTDSIDKRILTLETDKAISNVSVYGKIIFVTPNLGEMVPDTNGTFGYDKNKVIESQAALTKILSQSGIPSTYRVVNTSL